MSKLKQQINIPNILTIVRILITPILWFYIYAMYPECFSRSSQASDLYKIFNYSITAIAILTFLVVTDHLDGKIARKTNKITEFGKLMDPIADKFLTLSLFVLFAICNYIFIPLVIIIFIREISVTVLRFIFIKKGFKVIPADKYGKIKTISQMVFCYLCLIPTPIISVLYDKNPFIHYSLTTISFLQNNIFAIFVTLITVGSGINYFYVAYKISKKNSE